MFLEVVLDEIDKATDAGALDVGFCLPFDITGDSRRSTVAMSRLCCSGDNPGEIGLARTVC